LTSWGSDLLRAIRVDALAHRRAEVALASAQWLAVDSEAGLNAASRIEGSLRNRATVFPWGIDLTIFGSTTPSRFLRSNLGWDEQTIVFSNRGWEPAYDIPTLLRGFALARKRNENLRLVLANDGPLRNQIKQLIEELGLREDVVHVGRISNLETAAYLSISDIYVSASISDGTSISLLEAMAGGVPPIVTNFESNREWVIDGQTGFTFEIGNVEALADVLIKAISNPALLTEISLNIRQTIAERGDWQVNQSKYIDAIAAAAKGTL